MTPKTQSVCKHRRIELTNDELRWACTNCGFTVGANTPVAEPASTGEPECGQFTGRYSHCKMPRGHSGSCNPLHGIVFEAARPSEPSAPHAGAYSGIGNEEVKWTMKGLTSQGKAAPQASAEQTCGKPAASLIPRLGMSWACALPPNHEGECAPGGNCVKHGKYICKPNEQPKCPKWPDCISAAAPQPVSGMYISETKPRKVDDARITEIFNREPVSGDAPKVEDAKK